MTSRWFRRSYTRAAAYLQIVTIAASPVLARADIFDGMEAVESQELESIRGGYSSPDGLEVSFGIEKAISVDGILQVATVFTAIPITKLLQERSSRERVSDTLPPFNILQSDFSAIAINTENIQTHLIDVLQNNVDQKVIDNITTINATISGLDLQHQLNLLNSLHAQMIEGCR